MTRINEIRTRASKASSGPWKSEGIDVLHGTGFAGQATDEHFGEVWTCVARTKIERLEKGERFHDAQFIAGSREDVPYLLGLIRRMRVYVASCEWDGEICVGEEIQYVCPECRTPVTDGEHKSDCSFKALLVESKESS